MFYTLCQILYLVTNTPYRPKKRDVFLLYTFCEEYILILFYKHAHRARIEVKAGKKKNPTFMSRRQLLGQDHDIKTVNKSSEVWDISNMLGAP